MNQEITGYMPAEKTDLTSVIKKYHAQLKGYIAKQIPSKEEAEDILQNVFYQLTKMYQKDTPIDQLSGWLYAVTRNQITDSYRKKTPESIGFHSTNEDEDYYFSELSEDDNTPEDNFLKSLIWEELEAALEELPAEQKSIFILTELEGFSFKEISETSGIPVNTLLSRKRYAVLYLREKLKELYDELIYK